MALLSMAMLGLILVAVTEAAGPSAHFNDFRHEAWPAYKALLDGHFVLFVQRGPSYIGSLVLRAPFALIPGIWGGGWQASYIASAVPCLVGLPILVSWALFQRRHHEPAPSTAWVMLVGTFTPPLFMAIFGGHPEDVLGGVLCLAGLMAALRNRPALCAIFLTAAIINKTWALAAFPVVLMALPAHRVRVGFIVLAVAGAVLGGLLALQEASSGGAVTNLAGAGSGGLFNPGQLLWWFGSSSWIAGHARVLIVLLPFCLVGAWWLRHRHATGSRTSEQYLLLLALVLLLRSALDPWDNLYYHFPFLLAVLIFEVHTRRRPVLSVIYSVLLVFIAPVRGLGTLGLLVPAHFLEHPSAGLQAAAYALVTVPTLIWLVARLYLGRAPAASGLSRGDQGDGVAAMGWGSKPSVSSVQRL